MNPLFHGIDVSSYQGKIDWNAVKNSGVQFAVLRCGYGDDAAFQDDKTFSENLAACEEVGLPYGAYLYSYATSAAQAESEASHVLRLLRGHKPSYPVYYDLEDARTVGTLSNEAILNLAQIFSKKVRAGGFLPGFYANEYWWTTKLTDPWYDDYPRWIAQYASKNTYPGSYGMWQYTSHGSVPGIQGRVLLDYAYADYPAILSVFYQGASPVVPNPSPAPNPESVSQTVTVKPGDTLSGIARQYGVTWQKLASYNHLQNPNLIHPGEIIRIPPSQDGAPPEKAYTVRPGDTLSGIARQYGVTWQKLASYNHLQNPNLIHPGEIIRIPE